MMLVNLEMLIMNFIIKYELNKKNMKKIVCVQRWQVTVLFSIFINLSYMNIRALNLCLWFFFSHGLWELWKYSIVIVMMNFFFFSIRFYCYYHDILLHTCTVHISAMKLWMCAINCLRLYTWKNNAHISHIFLYVKASMLKFFFYFHNKWFLFHQLICVSF